MSPATFLLKAPIRLYQWFVSPLLGQMTGGHCRHWPSCSAYALEAVETHGAARGTWLALIRVLKCNPWGTHGYDPVPAPRAPKISHPLPLQGGD